MTSRKVPSMPGAGVLRIAMFQMNSTVGDLEGNASKIREGLRYARGCGAHIAAFPELALSGYPPEDLLHAPRFLRACHDALQGLIAESRGLTALVGYPEWDDDVYNSAAILHDGKLAGIARKHFLPTYGVFDEDRYFQRGDATSVLSIAGHRVGVSICEDIWYPDGPAEWQARWGDADFLVNLSASPFEKGKHDRRRHMLETRAADSIAGVAFVNAVGGQDDLVFDGRSLIVDEQGRTLFEAAAFEEGVVVHDVYTDTARAARLHDSRSRKSKRGTERRPVNVIELAAPKRGAAKATGKGWTPLPPAGEMSVEEEVYGALQLGLRDYVEKNGFSGVLIGLSGGIDSALTAAVAADALGSKRVWGITMPSRYSSDETKSDAAVLAKNLGIRFDSLAIEDLFKGFLGSLQPIFKKKPWNEAEENLQARIRGTLLMAVSNKFGPLVLSTGNKSEVSVGYATLYGDMAGGFNVLKDVLKTEVYRLSVWRNEQSLVIPESTITRPPTAELRENQRDQDSLPEYAVLDEILRLYVEEDRGLDEIVQAGHEEKIVRRIIRLVDRAEYKRRQAAPGIKITARAFGRDRRLPITTKFQN